jgi:hypothetical protein
MADTRTNLQQFMKGKQLHSALYGGYTEVLHNSTAVLKENAVKGETAKITIILHPSIHREILWRKKANVKICRRCRQKSREACNIHHGSQRPPVAVEGWSFPEVHWNGGWQWKRQQTADVTQSGRYTASCWTNQVNLINLETYWRVCWKETSSSIARQIGPVVTKETVDLHPSARTSRAITSHTLSSIPNPRRP